MNDNKGEFNRDASANIRERRRMCGINIAFIVRYFVKITFNDKYL